MVFRPSASSPTAVFPLAVLLASATFPTAVLPSPLSVKPECAIAYRIIGTAVNVALEGGLPERIICRTSFVQIERQMTDCTVVAASCVRRQRVCSIGCVEVADGMLINANAPLAVFSPPVVLLKSAPAPMAVFLSAVLATRVPAPIAVLKFPSMLPRRESQPTAVLNVPVVRLRRAFCPSAVFPPG